MIRRVCFPWRKKTKFYPSSLWLNQYSVFSCDEKFIDLLKSSNRISEITQVHGLMVKTGLDHTPFSLSKLLASSVVDINYADSIFRRIQNPNLFMFNTMLRGYSVSDDPSQAFVVFGCMRVQSILLDQFTFISILKCCAHASVFWAGLGIRSLVIRSGFDLYIKVKNTLLRFYCACGRIEDAHQLFDEFAKDIDLVSWNTLMGGYLQVSQPAVVLELYKQLCSDGRQHSSVTTMLCVLGAVGDLNDILGGESLHAYCMKIGFCLDLNVVAALIAMYGKTGCISSGRRVFDEVPIKDVVLWNCLINIYARSNQLEESLVLLRLMSLEQMMPNSLTLVGLLTACAACGALGIGQCIHHLVEEEQLVLDAVLGTALVHMYCKCGLLGQAIDVFNKMESKDVKSWTTMILGYGVNGQARNAITLFHRMEEEGLRPNEVTFLAVLSSCSHGGLVTEGMKCFERMIQDYGVTPKLEHYGCVIDLLGRAGLLEEAYSLIKRLPINGDATAWRALLAACRVHGNTDLGESVKRELEIYDEHPADSIILNGTYAICGRVKDHTMISKATSKPTGKKDAGRSSIELNNEWSWDDLLTVHFI